MGQRKSSDRCVLELSVGEAEWLILAARKFASELRSKGKEQQEAVLTAVVKRLSEAAEGLPHTDEEE